VSKQLWISLLIGLAVVGIGIAFVLIGTQGNHLELTGTILKVRVMPLSPTASLVIVDFRVTDPSDVPFVMKGASLTMEPASGETLDGMTVSKSDIENLFQYNPLLGPKFNDVLGIKDRIAPHQRLDRMVGARFEIPESQVEDRKAIHLHIEEIDGVTADFTEKKK
jgi:hypothetical protein